MGDGAADNGAAQFAARAQRFADDVLFPAAIETDRADVVPAALLDGLAAEGFYGLPGPPELGGLGDDFFGACAVVEALASGCLTTTFVWVQHLGAVRAALASETGGMAALAHTMLRGERRAGLALGGALPGPALLTARPTAEGWQLDGVSPFVSGWGCIDVVHVAARTDDGRLVWALIDAHDSPTLTTQRLDLIALNATATVTATFRSHPVAADRVTSVTPYAEGPTPPQVLRLHASLALGVAKRCGALLGSSPFADELADCRNELDRLDPATIEVARATAGLLAWRCAGLLMAETGSRSLLVDNHAQRLLREAAFTLVYALRPGSKAALLDGLRA